MKNCETLNFMEKALLRGNPFSEREFGDFMEFLSFIPSSRLVEKKEGIVLSEQDIWLLRQRVDMQRMAIKGEA